MGPGKEFEKGMGIMNPPVFEPDQDLLTWRKKIASWADLIATSAKKGEYKLYKTVFHTLARQLYDRGLRQAQQSIVDEAQEQGKIDYKQDDQVQTVQEIVDLIAQDPPIAVVTRLIDSFNKVTSCKRKPNEDLNRFVSRFRGLAAEHLMRAGSKNSSQIGEVLAITLLNNASLSESSLTNAKLRLITMAEELSKLSSTEEKSVKLTVPQAKQLLKRVSETGKSIGTFRTAGSARSSLKDVREKYNKMDMSTKPLFQQVNKEMDIEDVAKAIASSGPRCVLSLDDGVTVLRSLAQTHAKVDQQPVTKAQVETAVDQKVRTFFSNQKASQVDSGANINSTKNGKIRKSGHKRKAENTLPKSNTKPNRDTKKRKRPTLMELVSDACMDCGHKGHMRGDSKCNGMGFATMKLREAWEAESDESDDEEPTRHTGYFRPGSKHSKSK